MPQSLSAVLVHLVFSTKSREPWLRAPIDRELHAYATTVLTNTKCPTLAMNGMADHIHVLFNLSREFALAHVVKELKTSTSKWIKTKGPNYRNFHWQSGYGAFAVANQASRRLSNTFSGKKSIIGSDRFKTSFGRCCAHTT